MIILNHKPEAIIPPPREKGELMQSRHLFSSQSRHYPDQRPIQKIVDIRENYDRTRKHRNNK